MPTTLGVAAAFTAMALALGVAAAPASAQLLQDDITQTAEAGLVRNEGAEPDLSLTFTNADGKQVTLGDAFDGETPVILCLAYFDCPLICPLTMQNLSRAVSGIDGWTAGDDYRVLVISFDHNDGPRAATLQRDRFLGPGFSHEPRENGVLFWTAEPDQVRQLAETVGFFYTYFPDIDEFSHTSALILMTPDGVVHNYYPGIDYESPTLKRLLLEAGSSGERTLIEQAALYCFTWNPDENRWAISPMRVMQLVGTGTVLVVAVGLGGLFITDRVRAATRRNPS
jgi:protein SCO1/2